MWFPYHNLYVCSPLLVALEWLFVACWGIVMWSNYVSLLRELTLAKVWTLGLISYHWNTVYAHFYRLLPCCFLLLLLQKTISTIITTLVSPSLRRTSAPIQITIVFGVLGTQETLCYWYISNLSIIFAFMLLCCHSWIFYNHFIATLYHFLALTYWHSAQCQSLFFACFFTLQKTNTKWSPNAAKLFVDIFWNQKTHDGPRKYLRGAPRGATKINSSRCKF